MKILRIIQISIIFWTNWPCWCSLCPNNSTIMTDDSRFWCVWLVEQKLTIEHMINSCASYNGFVFETPDNAVQLFFNTTLVPILEAANINIIWVNYNVTSAKTFEGEDTGYTHWVNDPSVGEACVIAASPVGYLWDMSSCWNGYAGLCYRELNCHPTGIYILTSDLCFWPTFQREKPAAGESRCNTLNGTLAVIPDAYVWDVVATNQMIIDTNTNYGDGLGFWLGINDRIEEKSYRLINGDGAPYLKWDTNEPSDNGKEYCILMNIGGMADEDCICSRISLCMKGQWEAPPSVSPSTFPITTEATTPCEYLSCSCPAEFYNVQFTNDSEAFTQHLYKLKMETSIDVKNTSAYRMSLVCATDDRPSSQVLGLTAAIIIMTLFGLVVIADVAIGKALSSTVKTKK